MRLGDLDKLRKEIHLEYSDDLGILDVIDSQPTIEVPQWILCNERLPEEPKENPVFDNKPLELYLVSEKDADYPFRAFWNGKTFTDGFGKLNVIAWQPLPSVWKGENNAEK